MNGQDTALDELTRILLRLDGFRDAGTRRVLLEELAAETGEDITVTGTDPVQQARSLVHECARRPGALLVLVDLLHDFHGETAETERFRELAPRLLPSSSLLTEGERRALPLLLRSWESGGWRSAYAWVAALVPEQPENLGHALELLEDLTTAPGNVPPLVRFVLTLADRSAPPDRLRLREWAHLVADRLGIAADVLDDPAAPERSRPREGVTLVLRLQPFLPARPEYLLSAWLGHGDRQWIPLVHENEPQRLDQISARVGTFLCAATEYDRHGPSRIEFMLPRELINLPVEQWMVSTSTTATERALGHLYPVVVRDQDRQLDPHARRLWEDKWQRLLHGRPDPPSPLLLDAGDAPTRPYELAQRTRAALTVLVSGTTTWQEQGTTLQEHLELALDAGVPVMVWDRRGGRESTLFLRELASRLFDAEGLSGLPRTILDLRRRSERDVDRRHRSADLALLWDDPERTPLRAGTFRAPL